MVRTMEKNKTKTKQKKNSAYGQSKWLSPISVTILSLASHIILQHFFSHENSLLPLYGMIHTGVSMNHCSKKKNLRSTTFYCETSNSHLLAFLLYCMPFVDASLLIEVFVSCFISLMGCMLVQWRQRRLLQCLLVERPWKSKWNPEEPDLFFVINNLDSWATTKPQYYPDPHMQIFFFLNPFQNKDPFTFFYYHQKCTKCLQTNTLRFC